ncbi:MAG: hypothetical protein K2J14_02795, partial [Treponemataceae bacterium]|nr:hypothetical protein [Treponemataceae bacterium]
MREKYANAIFSFCKSIYDKGHWYSKKEHILDGIVFIGIAIIGEAEIVLYMASNKVIKMEKIKKEGLRCYLNEKNKMVKVDIYE